VYFVDDYEVTNDEKHYLDFDYDDDCYYYDGVDHDHDRDVDSDDREEEEDCDYDIIVDVFLFFLNDMTKWKLAVSSGDYSSCKTIG
jgi:hypothetical protein